VKNILAEKLANDPRLAEAKRLIHEAIADQQKLLTSIASPREDREVSFAQMLAEFSELRGGELYFPYLGSGIGRGPLVELADGSVKFDMISGIGVHYFGHNHPKIIDAAIDAAIQDVVMQGNLQQNVQSLEVTRMLVAAAAINPTTGKSSPIKHCILTTSGAMANENALKILFQSRAPADRILCFEGCFAGRTMVLSQMTDKPAYRQGLPTVLAVDYVPFFDAAKPAESIARAAEVLQSHLHRYPKRHAGMCVELVQGEGGFNAGDREFFLKLLTILRGANVPIWFDEVQTFGRTGELFAFQHFGLEEFADVVTIGKMTQLCATLFRAEMKPKPGLVSQTFTGSTAAIFAAKVVLHELTTGNFFGPSGRIARFRGHFLARLDEISHRHPGWISGPFGLGAMIAFTPFDGNADRVKGLLHALFKAGVIAFIAGAAPARVRFLPAMGAITVEDIDQVYAILERTMGEFLQGEQSQSGEKAQQGELSPTKAPSSATVAIPATTETAELSRTK
jgi:4-aminobutyrate aminotransferase-like enzyme